MFGANWLTAVTILIMGAQRLSFVLIYKLNSHTALLYFHQLQIQL